MTRVIITTRTTEEMKKILEFARKTNIRFEAVAFTGKNDKPGKVTKLSDEDWISPGQKATPSERKEHAEKISKQRGGISTEKLLDELESW